MSYEDNNDNNNAMNSISEADLEMIRKMRAKEEQEKVETAKLDARKSKLNGLMNDENFKYLYDNGLKDMLDKDPNILDSEGTLSSAIGLSKTLIQAKASPQTEPERQPLNNSAPLNPAPIQSEPVNSEEGHLLQGLTYEQKVKAGMKKTDAMLSTAFPPKKEIRFKQD